MNTNSLIKSINKIIDDISEKFSTLTTKNNDTKKYNKPNKKEENDYKTNQIEIYINSEYDSDDYYDIEHRDSY